MDLELRGKVALLTGGSGPIAQAAARLFVGEGARVALASRTPEPLERAVALIAGDTGGEVIAIPTDVTSGSSVRSMAETVAARFGRLDILVNGAAPRNRAATRMPLADTCYEHLQQDFDVKVMGYLRCAQAVVPYMEREGWGRIINVSGLNARNATSTIGAMRNVSVVALTKNLAGELGPLGINVTCIHPALVRTERTSARFAAQAEAQGIPVEEVERREVSDIALRRLMTPEEIAYVILFLASPRSVSVSGDVIVTGGGAGRAIYY